MINPSSLNLLALPSVALEQRSQLPKTPAVYFCLDADGRILYIGQSSNPQLRWEYHHRQKQLELIDGITIAWLTIEFSELLTEVEAVLINWFNPPFNFIKPRLAEVLEECRIIEQLRQRVGLTQRQVADALGKTDQTVSNWENGVRALRLTPRETLTLCRVLKCTLEELASENQE